MESYPRTTIKLVQHWASWQVKRGKFSWAGGETWYFSPISRKACCIIWPFLFCLLEIYSMQFCHMNFSPPTSNHFCDELNELSSPDKSHLQHQTITSLKKHTIHWNYLNMSPHKNLVQSSKTVSFCCCLNRWPCQWLTESLSHLRYFYFWHKKSDSWDLWPFRHLTRVMSRHDLIKRVRIYLPTYLPTYLPHLQKIIKETS